MTCVCGAGRGGSATCVSVVGGTYDVVGAPVLLTGCASSGSGTAGASCALATPPTRRAQTDNILSMNMFSSLCLMLRHPGCMALVTHILNEKRRRSRGDAPDRRLCQLMCQTPLWAGMRFDAALAACLKVSKRYARKSAGGRYPGAAAAGCPLGLCIPRLQPYPGSPACRLSLAPAACTASSGAAAAGFLSPS